MRITLRNSMQNIWSPQWRLRSRIFPVATSEQQPLLSYHNCFFVLPTCSVNEETVEPSIDMQNSISENPIVVPMEISAQNGNNNSQPNLSLLQRKTVQPPSNWRLSLKPLIQEKWSLSTLSWTVEPPESSSTATTPRATGSILRSSLNPFQFTMSTELWTRLVPSLKWRTSSWDIGIIRNGHYSLSLA